MSPYSVSVNHFPKQLLPISSYCRMTVILRLCCVRPEWDGENSGQSSPFPDPAVAPFQLFPLKLQFVFNASYCVHPSLVMLYF